MLIMNRCWYCEKVFSNDIIQLQELEVAVNALYAHGGGDCPELGMTGICNALDLVNPDSNVIVLTDASPKDEEIQKQQQVIDKANEERNSIHFFLSRSGCGDFTPYLDVAAATEGIVVNQISDFEAFAEFAQKVVDLHLKIVEVNVKDKFPKTAYCFLF